MEKICFPIFFRGHDFMGPPTQRSSTEPHHLKSTKFDLPPHDSHKMTPCFSIDIWGVVQKLISLVTPLIGWGGINQGTPKYSWCSAKKFPSTTYSWKCPPRSLRPFLLSFWGEPLVVQVENPGQNHGSAFRYRVWAGFLFGKGQKERYSIREWYFQEKHGLIQVQTDFL